MNHQRNELAELYVLSKSGKTKRTFLQKRSGSKLAKTKRSKIDKRTVQKKHRKNIFLRCFFIALSFGYLTKNH